MVVLLLCFENTRRILRFDVLRRDKATHFYNSYQVFPREIKNSKPKIDFSVVNKKLDHIPVQTLGSLNKKCADPNCLDYLTKLEKDYFDKCKEKVVSMKSKFGPMPNTSHCKFQNGFERVPVALASFPGSGNTWVRGLLERATGICTGTWSVNSHTTCRGEEPGTLGSEPLYNLNKLFVPKDTFNCGY